MSTRRSEVRRLENSDELLLSRNEITPLKGAVIDGTWRAAGAVYPIKVPVGSRAQANWEKVLLPGWSVSWTTLPNHETLDSHYHPVESFVAIVRGRGQLIGQQTEYVDAGSVVRIPPWHLHGFKTIPDQPPFWALTWQRLPNSLFTGEEPNVFYPGDKSAPAEPDARVRVEIVNSRVKPFEAEAGSPRFEFLDLSVEKQRKIQVEGRALLFSTNGSVSVSMNNLVVEMKEGDMLPLFSQTVQLERTVAGSTAALMEF